MGEAGLGVADRCREAGRSRSRDENRRNGGNRWRERSSCGFEQRRKKVGWQARATHVGGSSERRMGERVLGVFVVWQLRVISGKL
jgi:hypothetical protein